MTYLGDHVRRAREAAGMSRGQLAARIGYRSLGKGARRIHDLEQLGDRGRGDLVGRVVAALGLDVDQVRNLVERDREDVRRVRELWLDEPVDPVFVLFAVPGVPLTEKLPPGIGLRAAVRAGIVRALRLGVGVTVVWSRRIHAVVGPDGRFRGWRRRSAEDAVG